VKSVLTVGVDAALTLASASSRAASERESVGIAAAGVAGVAAADTGVDDGLVSGDTASLSVSLLLPTPPQGLHETNFPSADGARAKPGPSSLSLPLPLPPTGPETTLPPLCRAFGIVRFWAMLSLRMTLPLFPSILPLERVGWAVTALTLVTAAVIPSGRSASWLGRAWSVCMSIPLDIDTIDSWDSIRRSPLGRCCMLESNWDEVGDASSAPVSVVLS
jgi:hypothetical protein